MKRVFGLFEAVFDGFYLIFALSLGAILLFSGADNNARMLAGIMALVLALGDAFHLLPRIAVILTKEERRWRSALGRGKQITSITMTIFYLLLWQIGLLIFPQMAVGAWSYVVYFLGAVRIALCLLPQNQWLERYPPIGWGILRNIPFFLLGAVVAMQFFLQRNTIAGLSQLWLAIVLSFAFYLPVTLWANRNPKIGMLMLPKSCAYLWMLVMCLSL